MSNKTSILYQQKGTKHLLIMIPPPPTPRTVTFVYQVKLFFFKFYVFRLFFWSPLAHAIIYFLECTVNIVLK